MTHSRPLAYRAVSAEVFGAFAAVLGEMGRLPGGDLQPPQVPQADPPLGWSERSGASWAGLLKRVERRLHELRPEYAVLRVTATDGHRTWRTPVSVSVHLLTEKVLAAQRAPPALVRQARPRPRKS